MNPILLHNEYPSVINKHTICYVDLLKYEINLKAFRIFIGILYLCRL